MPLSQKPAHRIYQSHPWLPLLPHLPLEPADCQFDPRNLREVRVHGVLVCAYLCLGLGLPFSRVALRGSLGLTLKAEIPELHQLVVYWLPDLYSYCVVKLPDSVVIVPVANRCGRFNPSAMTKPHFDRLKWEYAAFLDPFRSPSAYPHY